MTYGASPRAPTPVTSRAVRATLLDGPRDIQVEKPLERAAEAYAAMDERRAIKVLLRPETAPVTRRAAG